MKILTRKLFANDSALLLCEELQSRLDENVEVTTDWRDIDSKRFIRYGNSDPVEVSDTTYNSRTFIRLVANKWTFAALLQNHNIHCPRFYTNRAPRDNEYPVLIRTTLCSSGGRGIIVCRNSREFNSNWNSEYFWTPFVRTSFECRVHVLGGSIAKIFIKEGHDETDTPIRNINHGYHFAIRDESDYPGITKLVKNLSTFLTGKFYSLDIGWDPKAKKYFVFEANSASGLNSKTVKLYADYIAQQFL